MQRVSLTFPAPNLQYWSDWNAKNTNAGRKRPLPNRMFLSSGGRNLQPPAREHCSYCGCFLRCFLQLPAPARALPAPPCLSAADRRSMFNDFQGVCLSLQPELKVIGKRLCFSSVQAGGVSASTSPPCPQAGPVPALHSPARGPCSVSALV